MVVGSLVAKTVPRSADNPGNRGIRAARAVQKQTPLWQLVEKYHGLGASPDERAQKDGLRHVFLDVLRTALEFSKVPKTQNVASALTPEYFRGHERLLLLSGISQDFLETDAPLQLTRMQAAVLFGTEMSRTGKFMSVSREYLSYLLRDFEEGSPVPPGSSQRPVAVPSNL